MSKVDFDSLRRFAADIRINTLRAMHRAGGGHVGGSLSVADALAVLYGSVMRVDPANPRDESRDRLVLSKGHCGPALYSALAQRGFFPVEELIKLNQGGTFLPSHCDRIRTPGIDMTAGSLGQGISCACGIAYGLRLKNTPPKVYAIIGDGEMQEGQVWEAIQFAAHHRLSNLMILVDSNKKQLDDLLKNIMEPFDLQKKFEAFGLRCVKANAHDVEDIYRQIADCAKYTDTANVILLEGYKGIGCSFAENADFSHFMSYDQATLDTAIEEIESRLAAGIVGEVTWYE